MTRPWDDTSLGRWQRHQFEMDRIGGHYRPGPSDAEEQYREDMTPGMDEFHDPPDGYCRECGSLEPLAQGHCQLCLSKFREDQAA